MSGLIKIGIGVFAMAWVIARAAIQSITIDEAFSYLTFVAREPRLLFYPGANNHLLNSLLMWLTTRIFGVSGFTVRLPALAGAALYIVSCYALCRLLKRQPLVEGATLAALVLNPFVMDYLVAARGYSLALGFLMAALALAAHRRTLWLISACLGLSFLSNFAFAIIDMAALILIAIWFWPPQDRRRWLAALLLPGLTVTLLALPLLLRWPSGQLEWGAGSLKEMFLSFGVPSFKDEGDGAPGIIIVLLSVGLAILLVARRFRLEPLAGALTGIALGSLLFHWVLFRAVHLPLPKDRTGLYVVPLLTLAVGAMAAVQTSGLAEWGRGALVAAILVADLAFVSCLRLDYFREWDWQEDMRGAYSELARLNHQNCVNKVDADWRYAGPLNFYRTASRHETFPEIKGQTSGLATEPEAYVLHSFINKDFIEREQLKAVWKGERDVVVAVRPGVLERHGCVSAAKTP